jgi:Na+-driven multidrug efflux pump
MLREVVFGVGFALALPPFLGLDGVLYSMPVSDLLTLGASVAVLAVTYRELSRPALSRIITPRPAGESPV